MSYWLILDLQELMVDGQYVAYDGRRFTTAKECHDAITALDVPPDRAWTLGIGLRLDDPTTLPSIPAYENLIEQSKKEEP